jgi:hypothetical protein
MSDYNKSTNFTTKDTLPSGNANKIVKGTELDIEFTNIASAITSKANLDSPALSGTPTTPTATIGSNTTQIASCAFVLANSVPSGLISMWAGSIASIPAGWVLCNGSNGTPDLRNKFIIGADADVATVAKTSITGTATLTGGTKDAIVVSHTHTATSTSSVTDPGHIHQSYGSGAFNGGGDGGAYGQAGTGYGARNLQSNVTGISVSTSTSVASTGSDGTNQNLPPYYALAFIMKS